jgi:hypothetical protein
VAVAVVHTQVAVVVLVVIDHRFQANLLVVEQVLNLL